MVCGSLRVNMSNQEGHDMKKAVLLCGLLLAGAACADITVDIDYDSETISVDGAEVCPFHEISGTLTSSQKQELKSVLEARIAGLSDFIEGAAANGNYGDVPGASQKMGSLQTIVEMLG